MTITRKLNNDNGLQGRRKEHQVVTGGMKLKYYKTFFMAILLKNATYIDWKTLEFRQTDILAEEDSGTLQFTGDAGRPLLKPEPEVLDCTGKLVTKSLAVGHHHAYSALSRGMGTPARKPENFYEILKYIWWTIDKNLDHEMIESSALVTAIASAKAGSTFVIDHHASPFAIKGSLELIARAFDKVGISHLLCYEISDRDGMEISSAGLEETKDYLTAHQGLVGLHASFTVGDNTMKQAVEMMNRFDTGIHIHAAEDRYDQAFTLRNHGKRVIERLNDFGMLHSAKTILAHCLHLEESERELIRNSPCWVVQNVESNLNNNTGHFNGVNLGQNIMLGTDGMHSDMLRSAQAAFFAGQGFDTIDYQSAYGRLRNVSRYIRENHFKGDGENNLVVLDYDSPTEINQENFLSHFIFGLTSRHVQHVISNGRLIVRDQRVQTVNEAEILEVSKECAGRLWKKMKQ
jgi:cytosine/adenosine deaminase-related metal-dependent hydrolase